MIIEWYISIISLSLFSIIGYYFFSLKKAKELNKIKTNIIKLQNDGYDYILYKGKIKEMISDYHHYLTDIDIIIYSKSIFIGTKETNKVFLQLSANTIQSARCDSNKIVLKCLQNYYEVSNIILVGFSTNQIDILFRRINFILKRSRKIV